MSQSAPPQSGQSPTPVTLASHQLSLTHRSFGISTQDLGAFRAHFLCQTVWVWCLAFWCRFPGLISCVCPSLFLACCSHSAPVKNRTFCLTWGPIPNLPLALGVVLSQQVKMSEFSVGLRGRARQSFRGRQTGTSPEL